MTFNADNGHTGLALEQKQDFDAVITDIIMPGQDGLEVIRELKKRAPARPIIAISAYENEGIDYLQTAKQFGANATLNKDDIGESILATLQGVLA